jgi:hypothetical protein
VLLTRDIVDAEWEYCRLRGLKPGIVHAAFPRVAKSQIADAGDAGVFEVKSIPAIRKHVSGMVAGDAQARPELERMLEHHKLTVDIIAAGAFADTIVAQLHIDRMAAAAYERRKATYAELEHVRARKQKSSKAQTMAMPYTDRERDSDAVGVARQIAQHLLGTAEWRLAVDHPFAVAQWRQECGKGLPISERRMIAEELQFSSPVSGDELNASSIREINAAFTSFMRERADALFVSAGPFVTSRRVQLALLAARHAVPAAYAGREHAEVGGLLSYGASVADAYRGRRLYRSHPQGRQAYGPTGRAGDEARAGHQCRHRQFAGPHHTALAARRRRRGDRVEMPFAAVHWSATGTQQNSARAAVCPQLAEAEVRP